MSEAADSARHRIDYLESIRGLAALQVLLLHTFGMFVPGVVFSQPASLLGASIHLSPLYFLYDGNSAVYIFFTLSGFVLTRFFAEQTGRPLSAIGARAIRLGLPALAAALISATVLLVVGRHNEAIAALTGSGTYLHQWNPDLSIGGVLRDGVFNALLFGYSDLSGLPFSDAVSQPIAKAFVAPFWTLSIEFYGSLLVLGLCICAKGPRWLWWTVAAAAALFFCRSAFLCFVVGHIVAMHGSFSRKSIDSSGLPILSCVIGIALCVSADVWNAGLFVALSETTALPLYPGQFPQQHQKAIGAMFVLCGLVAYAPARAALSKPWLVRWSKLSFPLYLVHWPILFGPAAALFVGLNAWMAPEAAVAISLAAAIAMSLFASLLFLPVDRFAMNLARRLRRPAVRPPVLISSLRVQPAD